MVPIPTHSAALSDTGPWFYFHTALLHPTGSRDASEAPARGGGRVRIPLSLAKLLSCLLAQK